MKLAIPAIVCIACLVAGRAGVFARDAQMSIFKLFKSVILERQLPIGTGTQSTLELRMLGGILLFSLLVNAVVPWAATGYMEGPTEVLHDPIDSAFSGCEKFDVLWAGQTSIVGRCRNQTTEVRVIGRSDKRTLVTHKVH